VSGINIDDIQLGDELGRGASSKVHLAVLKTNGQRLAIKCLLNVHDKEMRKQLRAELHFMEVLAVQGGGGTGGGRESSRRAGGGQGLLVGTRVEFVCSVQQPVRCVLRVATWRMCGGRW